MRSGIAATMFSLLLVASCSNDEGAGDPSPAQATASPSPSPTVQVLADCDQEICEGDLQFGTVYRSRFYDPSIDFEMTSPGWTWSYSGNFWIVADPNHLDLYPPDGIYFLRDPAIASQDCEESHEPGVGRSVDDLVEWIGTAPGLSVSEPASVTVGGLEGMQLDIELDPGWKRPCFFSRKTPVVPLLFNGAKVGGYHWTVFPQTAMRWYVLRSDHGVIIVDIEDGPGGLDREDLFRTGKEIVDTLVFTSR